MKTEEQRISDRLQAAQFPETVERESAADVEVVDAEVDDAEVNDAEVVDAEVDDAEVNDAEVNDVEVKAWELIDAEIGRYMPRRIRGSFRGRALG